MNTLLEPNSNIWIAYGCVFAVLLVGSSVTHYLIRAFPERNYTNLRLRVRTWWMIVPPLIVALSLGQYGIAVLFALASGVILREYLAITGSSNLPFSVIAAAYLSIPIQFHLACDTTTQGFAHRRFRPDDLPASLH